MMHLIVAGALLLTQAAPTEEPCLTREEAGDATVVLLPYVIDDLARRCRAHLPSDAFLATGAAELSARLRHEAEPRRASALRGIGKLGGIAAPAGTESEATFDFVAPLIAGPLAGGIPVEACADVDDVIAALSPLPAANLALLVGSTLSLVQSSRAAETEAEPEAAAAVSPEDNTPTICRA